MASIGRYIIRQSLAPLLFTLAVLTAIVWLTQSLQRVDLLVERGQSVATFFSITVLIIPSLLAVITPLALFAATLYALNRMHSDSEIVVMFASGMSRWRLARPLLLLAVGGAVVTIFLNLFLMPACYRLMKERVADIRADIATGLIRGGEFTSPATGLMFYAETSAGGGQFTGLLIVDRRAPEKPRSYLAQQGLFRDTASGPQLILKNGNAQEANQRDGSVDFINFDEYVLDMTQFVPPRGELQLELTERFLSELFNPDLARKWDADNKDRLIAEGHNRLAAPIYNIVYVLIAIVALVGGAYSRRGYGMRIAIAAGAAVVIRVFGFVAQSAAAGAPELNFLQYAVPILAVAGCVYLLSDLKKPTLRIPDFLQKAPAS